MIILKFKKCQITDIQLYSLVSSGCKDSLLTAPTDCDYLYIHHDDFSNKYKFDLWITSIIFDALVLVLTLGLIIFGFLLFKDSNGSSGHTPV